MCAAVWWTQARTAYPMFCRFGKADIYSLGAHGANHTPLKPMGLCRVCERQLMHFGKANMEQILKRKWSRRRWRRQQQHQLPSIVVDAYIYTHKRNHRHRYETRYIRFSSLDVVIHDDNVIQHGVEICKFNVASSSSFGCQLISLGHVHEWVCVCVCECAALQSLNRREYSAHISLADKIVALDCNWILNKQLIVAKGIDARWLLCENVRMIEWVAMETKCTPCEYSTWSIFPGAKVLGRNEMWIPIWDFDSIWWKIIYCEIKMSIVQSRSWVFSSLDQTTKHSKKIIADQLQICSKKSNIANIFRTF